MLDLRWTMADDMKLSFRLGLSFNTKLQFHTLETQFRFEWLTQIHMSETNINTDLIQIYDTLNMSEEKGMYLVLRPISLPAISFGNNLSIPW